MSGAVIEEPKILNSIKRLLGIMPDITAFDGDVVIHINSVFAILTQMGVGPKNGFKITTGEETWNDYLESIEDNPNFYEDVKSFIYFRVKLMFDPPASNALLESYQHLIKEVEYRLYTQAGGF